MKDGLAQQRDEKNRIVGVVLRSQAKTIHFLRHAEGTHNKDALQEGRSAYRKMEHLDAQLTDFGKEQCAKLKATNHCVEKEAEVVVVSPLTRAIQTAMLSIDQVDGVPWIALECARERAGGHPCDRRRPVHELKEAYPTINFDEVVDNEDVYWEALGDKREDDEAMAGRARELFAWLSARPETNIAVVTHSAFLACLFNKALVSPAHLAKWFENCELRTVLLDL